MKVAFIVRSNLFVTTGGDTVQVRETAGHLNKLGVEVDVKLTNEKIDYSNYDLLHFFNIIRPSDILYHIERANRPYVVSTIFVEYVEFDKNYRKGLSGFLFKFFPADLIEYAKTIARAITGKDKLVSMKYLWLGQGKAIKKVAAGAAYLLPNSESEYSRLKKKYAIVSKHAIIPNGVSPLFIENSGLEEKVNNMVLCVARIEGIKNQLNLIKAINDQAFRLFIIGGFSPHQKKYYQQCRSLASSNIIFVEHLSQQDLVGFYKKAKVHILPSWFETTGLSSLEAAAMGCNVVITDRGDAKEYFRQQAFYCEPSSPRSIFEAVKAASEAPVDPGLAMLIKNRYTWDKAAEETYKVYKKILNQN